MKEAERRIIKDKRWISLHEVYNKQHEYLMSLDPSSEEYKIAQEAFNSTNEIILKFEEEEEKLSFEKKKHITSVIVRGIETVISVGGTIIFIGYEATNSMTSKLWPIISKKLGSLGIYSTTNI